MAPEAAPARANGPVALDRRPTREASSSGRAWGSRRTARYEEPTARSYGFHPVEWYGLPAPNARLCAEVPWRLAVRERREVEGAGWAGDPAAANREAPTRPREEWSRLRSHRP